MKILIGPKNLLFGTLMAAGLVVMAMPNVARANDTAPKGSGRLCEYLLGLKQALLGQVRVAHETPGLSSATPQILLPPAQNLSALNVESSPLPAAPAMSEKRETQVVPTVSPTVRRPLPPVAESAHTLNGFIDRLKTRHVGYDSAITAIAAAALAREPVLVMGPGGNGKSDLSSVVESIVDADTNAPDFLSRNFGPDTSKADMLGPLSQSALLNRDVYERVLSASLARHHGARIEEFFDASPNVVRAFHEIYDDKTRVLRLLIATTNKTLDRLLVHAEDKYDDRELPRPTLNRFPIKIVVPRDFAQARQYLHMFSGVASRANSSGDGPMTWQHFDRLSQVAARVQIPLYVDAFLVALSLELRDVLLAQEVTQLENCQKRKKINGEAGEPPFVAAAEISKRFLMQSRRLLPAMVVLRLLEDPRALESGVLRAETIDVEALPNLAPIVAASFSDLSRLADREIDPNEKRQLDRARSQIEGRAALTRELLGDANAEYTRWGFKVDDFASFNGENLSANLAKLRITTDASPKTFIDEFKDDLGAEKFTGKTVARVHIATRLIEVAKAISQKSHLSEIDRGTLAELAMITDQLSNSRPGVAAP